MTLPVFNIVHESNLRLKLILSGFLLISISGFSQISPPKEISNLENILSTQKINHETKIQHAITLVEYYKNKNLKAAIRYTDTLLKYLPAEIPPTLRADAYNTIGGVFTKNNQREEAEAYYHRAISIAKKSNHLKALGHAYQGIGLIGYYNGEKSKTMDYFNRALNIFESLNDTLGIAYAFENIGRAFYLEDNYQKTTEYLLKANGLLQQTGNKMALANNYAALGGVYAAQKDIDKGLEMSLKALEIQRKMNDVYAIITNTCNIGTMYAEKEDYDKTLRYYRESLDSSQKINNLDGQAFAHTTLGHFYAAKLHNPEKAAYHYLQSIQFAKKNRSLTLLAGSFIALSKAFDQIGKCPESLEALKSYNAYRDTIHREEKEKQLSELQTRFETERKDREIQLLTTQNSLQASELSRHHYQNLIIFLIIGICGIVFFGIFYRYRENRKHALRLASKNAELTNANEEIRIQNENLEKVNKEVYEQQQLSDKLLLNILPLNAAVELKQKGKCEPRRFEYVTVIFTDIKGFTKYAENLAPEELLKELEFCFEKFDQICEEHNLERIKTLGDGYLCAGGIPMKNKTNAIDGVLACLKFQAFMQKEAGIRGQHLNNFWQLRIGVHTGPVVAGVIGTQRFAYDIWGDTVNTASRLESSGEVNKVNISEITYKEIKDFFTCRYRGKVSAKSKGELDMYFAERIKPELSADPDGLIPNNLFYEKYDQLLFVKSR